MKIFSWFHHQFHHKDVKKADNDKISLLENEAFEGILSIGTMRIDLIQDFKHNDDTFLGNNQVLYVVDQQDGEEDDHEEEMECPLVLKASKHGFEFDHVHKQDPLPCNEIAKPKNGQKDVVKDSMDLDFENAKKTIIKSGERITLADLLRADSENNLLKNNNKLFDDHKLRVYHHDNNFGKQQSIKSSLISKKKEKLGKDDSSRSFNKTKQLIRKMLKKKIHPDVGIQKKETAST